MFGNFKRNGICLYKVLIGFVLIFNLSLLSFQSLAIQENLGQQIKNKNSSQMNKNKRSRSNKRKPASAPELVAPAPVIKKVNKNKWSVSAGLLTFSVLSENSVNISKDHLTLFANTWSGAYQIHMKNNWYLLLEPQLWLARLSYLQSLGIEGQDGITASGMAFNTKIIKNLTQDFLAYGHLGAVTLGLQSQGRIPKSVVVTMLDQPLIYSGFGVQSFFYKNFFLDMSLALISSNPGQTQSHFQVGYQF